MLADEDGDSGLFGTWTRGEKQLSLVLIVVLLYHFNVFSFVHRSRFRHTERARAPASARARTLLPGVAPALPSTSAARIPALTPAHSHHPCATW